MDKLHKYHSIENAKKVIDNIYATVDPSEEWVVLEKIHGANLSLTTDGKDVKFASRTMFLNDDSFTQFFKVNKTLDYLTSTVKDIFNNEFPDAKSVIIYGELFGGLYPGIKTNSKHIQKGVFYSPKHHFYAFDLYVSSLNDEKRGIINNYINYDKCVEIFTKYGLFYAEPLLRGTFTECIKWSNSHKSDITQIPAGVMRHYPELGELPQLEDNTREGHVLKPVVVLRFQNHDRIILKDKSEKFNEKTSKASKQNNSSNDMSNIDQKAEILSYVTQQRLDNVLSKIGDIDEIKKDKKYTGQLIKSFIEDVIKDALNDIEFPESIEFPEKVIKKVIQAKCTQMILAYMEFIQ
jgi:Rnl2 family RNA ligase